MNTPAAAKDTVSPLQNLQALTELRRQLYEVAKLAADATAEAERLALRARFQALAAPASTGVTLPSATADVR